jgi:hypothetical protein
MLRILAPLRAKDANVTFVNENVVPIGPSVSFRVSP